MTLPGPGPTKLPLASGGRWLKATFGTIRRWPAVFPVMGLIVAFISWIPLFGGLAVLILGPTFLAGCVLAAHQAEGGKPEVHQLFAVFHDASRRRETLKLCLPLIAGKFVAALMIGIALAHAVLASGADPATLERDPGKLIALLTEGSMPIWLVVGMAIMAAAWTFTALAIPRVALGRQTAFSAMRSSARDVWRNIGPWLSVLIVLVAIVIAIMAILSLTRVMALVMLAFYATLYTLLGPLLYHAWRDFNGQRPTTPDLSNPPPPPPDVFAA